MHGQMFIIKLIDSLWKLVTHARIDGLSRLIVFTHCSDNNQSVTVYKQFLKATRKYDLPSRVRTDQGRENIKQHMLEHRGTSCTTVIIVTGSSVHTQEDRKTMEEHVLTCYFYLLTVL